ncbi:MAG TPA: acylphosphatase [Anaerolineae bacterium]
MKKTAECLHAIIHGQVQGVNFRYYTRLQAQTLDVTGWVRNLGDGTVEVMAEGSRAALEGLLDFLQRGPSHAEVVRVDVEWQKPGGRFSDFRITY